MALLLTLGSRKVLLQHGAHVDLKDSRGNTALAVAEEAGNMAMSRLLRTSHHGEKPPLTSPASQRGEPATQAAPGDAFRDHEAHQAVAECAAQEELPSDSLIPAEKSDVSRRRYTLSKQDSVPKQHKATF